MVSSTRTKGSRPCTDSKRRKSLCRYFSLQHWCTVDAVSYGKTSHVVFARTKKSAADCPGFSRLLLSGLAPLFSPEERQQKRPVVFIDVRGVKKWGLSHWFKHVTHLWSVSLFLMLFVTVLMVLISNIFGFFCCFCLRDTTYLLSSEQEFTRAIVCPRRIPRCERLRDVD